MGAKKWGKYTMQLEWTDIETMARSIEQFHSASVSVIISPLGIGASGGLYTEVSAMFNVLPGSSIPKLVGVSGKWPCPEHDTLAAHVYAALYDLDKEIGRVYENKELWK